MPPRKRTSPFSFKPQQYKPKTLGQLSRTERERPRCARRGEGLAEARQIRDAMASCRCLYIEYQGNDAEPQRRLFCPAAIGLIDGLLKASGMQRKDSNGDAGHMAAFTSCILSVEPAESSWIATPGDLKDSNQFDSGRIIFVSQCPGDPPRDHMRLFRHRDLAETTVEEAEL